MIQQLLPLAIGAAPPPAGGNAASFAAPSSQNLSHASAAAINLGSGSFTLAFWGKINAAATQGCWSKDSGAGCVHGAFAGGIPILRAFASGIGYTMLTWGGSFSTATWHFITITYDAATHDIALNVDNSGSPVTATLGAAIPACGSDFLIGFTPDGGYGYLNGALDSFGIFNGYKLDATELSYLWNAGAGRAYSGLSAGLLAKVSCWLNLEEASGNRSDATGGTAWTDNGGVGQTTGVA